MPDYYSASSEGQLQNFLNFLGTSQGILLAILFVAVLCPLVLYFRQLKWTVLALMLWASTLGFIGIGAHFGWSATPIFLGLTWEDAPIPLPSVPSLQGGDRRLIVAACHATMRRMRRVAHIH